MIAITALRRATIDSPRRSVNEAPESSVVSAQKPIAERGGDMTEIAPATPIEAANAASCAEQQVLVRQILERVADKWTLLVIDALEQGEMRFSRLREKVGEVSQKMLTKTLRQLERDGLVTRRVYAEVPPRVDYRLTPLGHS